MPTSYMGKKPPGRQAPPPGWRPEAASSTASSSYATEAYQTDSSSSTKGGECLIMCSHKMQNDTAETLNHSTVTYT